MVREVIPSIAPRFDYDFLVISDRTINSYDELLLLHNEIIQCNPAHLILRNCTFNVHSVEDLFADLNVVDLDVQSCDFSRVMIFTNAFRNITFI